jgi:DMSO/TMAO reductase YedYZ heme-binding membrane subunit
LLAGRGRSGGRSRAKGRGARHPHQAERAQRRRRLAYGFASVLAVLAVAGAVAAAERTKAGQTIGAAVTHFLLFYAGVFALIALTASVGVGLAATDRVFMSPGGRIMAQALHRAASFGAAGFLVIHIAAEVAAGRSQAADSVVPFLDHRRTLYLGLGTIASDLVVLIVITGLLRGRFANARRAWVWRAMHALAYVCWPLAIVHGLLGGRTAKPYVDWSYGACVAAVALGMIVRFVAAARVREIPGSPVEASPSWAGEPGGPGLGAPGLGPPSLGSSSLGSPYQPWMPGNPVRRALPGPPSSPGAPGALGGPGAPGAPGPGSQYPPGSQYIPPGQATFGRSSLPRPAQPGFGAGGRQ